jgi:CTD small phosphatase-like protein 2
MLLVDNAPYSYYFQMENGVPIVPYYDNKDDS